MQYIIDFASVIVEAKTEKEARELAINLIAESDISIDNIQNIE